jgi:hypothetical protein
MQLKKSQKILLLLGTILPVLYAFFFMGMTLFTFMHAAGHKWEEPWIFKHFGYLFLMHGFVMLIIFGTLICYLIYIFKSNMDQQTKILWAVMIFVGGPIGMLVFWFVKIRSEPNPT